MSLELKVPPVLVWLIAAGLAIVLGVAGGPLWTIDADLARALAPLPALSGLAIAFLGVYEFRRAATTVDPRYPERAAQLVQGGVFRLTRNPMYLGLLLLLAALVIWMRSLVAVIVLPLFVLYLGRFQIAVEERAMAKHFGAEYEAYRRRVRRWL
jgi:protein-S-isoprenylcysteine O-methyltransferase Ste14